MEIGAQRRRISRGSAQFFLDWVEERIARVPLKLKDPKQLKEVLEPHLKSREFWKKLLETATCD